MPDPRVERDGGVARDKFGRRLFVIDTPYVEADLAGGDIISGGALLDAERREKIALVDEAGEPAQLGVGDVTQAELDAESTRAQAAEATLTAKLNLADIRVVYGGGPVPDRPVHPGVVIWDGTSDPFLAGKAIENDEWVGP